MCPDLNLGRQGFQDDSPRFLKTFFFQSIRFFNFKINQFLSTLTALLIFIEPKLDRENILAGFGLQQDSKNCILNKLYLNGFHLLFRVSVHTNNY